MINGARKPECIETENGIDYSGFRSLTDEGKLCQPWITHRGVYPLDSITPVDPISDHNFPDGSVRLARNYCRNPDNDIKGPWCWTGHRQPHETGYCSNIVKCGHVDTEGGEFCLFVCLFWGFKVLREVIHYIRRPKKRRNQVG